MMKGRKLFILPMALSMILLLGFIGYFLHSEFIKEKEAIMLESKDRSFNQFFAVLDNISTTKKKEDKPTFYFRRDTFSSGLNYEFKVETASEIETIDELIDSEKELKIEFLELTGKKKNRFPEKESTEVTVIFDNIELNSDFIKSVDTLGHDHWPERLPHLLTNSNEKERLLTLNREIEVSFWTVVKRLIPQLLLSIFLVMTILLAYWQTTRMIKKEREIGIIRNNFMSNMSHELKTPVSTIGVALEALSTFDAADNPELRKEYIDISRYEVERLGLLVDKALNISLYEQGRFVYDLQNINLKIEIEKVIKILKVQLDNHNVSLDYRVKGSDFTVNVDRTHMINVVYNLIENGIKYSEKDAEIDIDLQATQDKVIISITDKGPGIAPEHQSRVFEKFYRVDQGNKHNVKGHGLGLSYVKEVVEAMGGQVRLKSGINAGSTFIIEIPKSL